MKSERIKLINSDRVTVQDLKSHPITLLKKRAPIGARFLLRISQSV